MGISQYHLPLCCISPCLFKSEMAINSCWGIPSYRNLRKTPLPHTQEQLPCLLFPFPCTHQISCYFFCPLEVSLQMSLPCGCSVTGCRMLSIPFPLEQRLQTPKDSYINPARQRKEAGHVQHLDNFPFAATPGAECRIEVLFNCLF